MPDFEDSLDSACARLSLWSRNNHDQPQGVISYASALALSDLGDYDAEHIHLTVPYSFDKKIPSGCILHKESLNLSAIESRAGFMVTRPLKTLTDLRPFLEARGVWDLTLSQALENDQLSLPEAQALGLKLKSSPVPPARLEAEDANLPAGGEAASSAERPPQVILLEGASRPSAEPNGDASGSIQPLPMRERVFQMICQRTRPRHYRRAQAGFTLVELLVVTAIITILAGMLLPVLESALEGARKLNCANNLKQLGLGVNGYTEENQGWYSNFAAWRSNYWPCFGDGRPWKNWYPLSKLPGVYLCPSGKNYLYNQSGYNSNIFYEQGLKNDGSPGGSSNWPIQFLSTPAITQPSLAITHYCHWKNNYVETWSDNPYPPPFRTHQGGRPVLYADEHVKIQGQYVASIPWSDYFAGWEKSRLLPP